MKIINRLFPIIASFIFLSCGELEDSDIPSTYVNLTLDLTYEDKELNTVTAHKIYTTKDINTSQQEAVGFGGIIVYHSTLNGYVAYDIACPYELNANTVVTAEEFSLTATCPKCGSVYDLENGGRPLSGPSAENPGRKRLRIYSTTKVGNKIYVSN
ncbi:MAG: (2Fe-2S)-binding protein [Massilibacteroides sp.]|nr:(2Fe-2S)-binding protein [Massilibacteroides sp.]MDD4115719.1 (2Fe-2S)-binding protein [Massilibacteroides sp.]MDD4659392.1 (2Fe-2S)-binding protein [Massilibacteroides sp.]